MCFIAPYERERRSGSGTEEDQDEGSGPCYRESFGEHDKILDAISVLPLRGEQGAEQAILLDRENAALERRRSFSLYERWTGFERGSVRDARELLLRAIEIDDGHIASIRDERWSYEDVESCRFRFERVRTVGVESLMLMCHNSLLPLA